MPYIKADDLVQRLTPEQAIMVQQFYKTFDIGAGLANKKILNVEPLFFMGAIAASEFLTYDVTKMYLCLSLEIDGDSSPINTTQTILLKNSADGNAMIYKNAMALYQTTLPEIEYYVSKVTITDLYFSRLVVTVAYSLMKFIGYRVTLGTV